jgi:hypothetical protein
MGKDEFQQSNNTSQNTRRILTSVEHQVPNSLHHCRRPESHVVPESTEQERRIRRCFGVTGAEAVGVLEVDKGRRSERSGEIVQRNGAEDLVVVNH